MWYALVVIGAAAGGFIAGRTSQHNVRRSLLKSAVRGTMKVGRAIETLINGAREELADITAEAKADIAKSESDDDVVANHPGVS